MNVVVKKPQITVRRATAADSALVLDFIQQLARYEKLEYQCIASADQIRETLFGPQPRAESLLAFADGQPAGFAVYFFSYSTFLAKYGIYLEDLFVKSELRARGVGKRIFLELLRVARDNGCGRFEWSVLDWNESAIGFYKKLGAEMMDGWTTCRLEAEAIKTVAGLGTGHQVS